MAKKTAHVVVDIRGTNGSGKSTAVHELLARYTHEPILRGGSKVYAYRVPELRLHVLGSYHTATGGCDGIPTQDLVCDRVREFAPLGHVLLEGMMVSHLFGRYWALAEELRTQYGTDYRFCFLDTPMDTCIANVQSRRDRRGDTRPFNPRTLQQHHRSTWLTRQSLEKVNAHIVDVPYPHVLKTVLAQFGVTKIPPKRKSPASVRS